MKKSAAYIDEDHHILDHIAPLCYILNIPLCTDDEKTLTLAKKYYPKVKTSFHLNVFEHLTKNFQALFSCKLWHSSIIASQKHLDLIFCPHGNSDKGIIDKKLLSAYSVQKNVLLYGEQMIDRLKKLKVFDKIKSYKIIGNYRYSYYLAHKKFYDDLAKKEVFSKLDPKNKNILYAPTWKDTENSSSFFSICKKLIDQLPQNYNLIIKLHPLLEKKEPVLFYQTLPENLPSNVLILDAPIVFPILDKTDIFLADFSSVGYDFLIFQKPMFFFDHLQRNSKNKLSFQLHKAGYQILQKDYENIFSFIEEKIKTWPKKFVKEQKELYRYAFGTKKSLAQIKKDILSVF
ncbi:MAG: CDP-glycerol glycerophosphotransferase family protein [Chlamydiae bacterium]|nr:CDP-glycerol glycerophosphotransferase family protein [Chlamydiota bacterium]